MAKCPRCNSDATAPVDKVLSGTAKGAASGAAVGSLIPVIGTSIGAAVGGILGFVGGTMSMKCKSCGHEWSD